MNKCHITLLALAVFVMVATSSSAIEGRATPATGQPSSIAVSISLNKSESTIGESPWALLTVKNLTDHNVVLHDSMIRIHIRDEKGERPQTRVQRAITGKLRPGEASPRGGEYAPWSIQNGESSTHKYELSYFYDLSAAGKYVVYFEVMDPVSRNWLRTHTVQFEMVLPTQ